MVKNHLNHLILLPMIKAFLVLLSLFILPVSSHATNWYVRTDGGTIYKCDGKHDLPFQGATDSDDEGEGLDCAFNHPYYALGVKNGAASLLSAGDTLFIHSGSYQFGLEGGSFQGCSASYPYDCRPQPIPSGIPDKHITIAGEGWDSGCKNPPQFWGSQNIYALLDLSGSDYVDLKCLELTDHESCRCGGPEENKCGIVGGSNYGQVGILAQDSDHVTLTDINEHGLCDYGLWTARLSDWTMTRVKINGNGQAGWNGEAIQGKSSNSGQITMTHSQVNWNGCSEQYPEKFSPVSCISQGQGGYSDGIGMADSGGNYLIEDTEVSWNAEDGIDLLHVTTDPASEIIIRRVRAEGNSGNNIKTGAAKFTVENTISISGCGYIADNFGIPGFDNRCRGGGEPLAYNIQPGSQPKFTNNTIIQFENGKNLSIVDKETPEACNGREKIEYKNNIMIGGNYNPYDDILSGSTCDGWSGATGEDVVFEYNNCFKAACNQGQGNITTDPLLEGDVSAYKPGMSVNLQANSPARNAATTSITFTDSSSDYNHFERRNFWDIGALQYGSKSDSTK